MLSHGIAKSLDELRYDFTIDQVYLFFEKCLKRELADRKFQAICMAQAGSYTQIPPMGTSDRSYFQRKQQSWDKFLNSLEWKNEELGMDIRKLKSTLTGAGIPVKIVKKKG